MCSYDNYICHGVAFITTQPVLLMSLCCIFLKCLEACPAADPGNILGGAEQHCCSILNLCPPYTIELCLKIHRGSTVICTVSVWIGGAWAPRPTAGSAPGPTPGREQLHPSVLYSRYSTVIATTKACFRFTDWEIEIDFIDPHVIFLRYNLYLWAKFIQGRDQHPLQS